MHAIISNRKRYKPAHGLTTSNSCNRPISLRNFSFSEFPRKAVSLDVINQKDEMKYELLPWR